MTTELQTIVLIACVLGIIILHARIRSPKITYDNVVECTINDTETYINHKDVAQTIKDEDDFREANKI